MNSTQLIHYQEQVEAARIEFDAIWRQELEGRQGVVWTESELFLIEMYCWKIFLRAKGLRK
jgi:hypothetical protein